jgi:hypothetical protein
MPLLRSPLVLGVVGLLASCAGRIEPAPLVTPPTEATPLSEVGSLGIAARLAFNGHTAWFVLDTGAGMHTLAQWFVDAAGIQPGEKLDELSALDATGAPVDVQVVRDQPGVLVDGGGEVNLEVALVSAFPPVFEEAGIGGLLNPQLLAPSHGAAVLDLRVPELRIEPFDEAVRRLGARVFSADEVRVCGSPTAVVPNLVYGVLVRANRGEGWLQLDTGADATVLTRDSRLAEGAVLEPGGESMGIAGQAREYLRARALTLSIAEHRVEVDAQVVDTAGMECGPDGLLGRDGLGGCALVMGHERLAIRCGH